jgi:aminopeptidase N
VPGLPGFGDPFFPFAGNGGYDVQHYSLALDYTPATDQLSGRAVITAKALDNLESFNLDLRDFLAISRLQVGTKHQQSKAMPKLREPSYARDGQEVIVQPRPKLQAGDTFVVVVEYAGIAQPVVDPDGSWEGFIPTDDGAYVVNEPQGSPGWYPVNDDPSDKASFDFTITVPEGITALANGVLVSSTTAGGKTTWAWKHAGPMAPYLATATLGVFDLTVTTLSNGVPSYVAVDPRITNRANLALIPAMVEFFSATFGPYPWDAAGAIADSASFVGYALETQTKANYDRNPGEGTVAHELAHEWFGNAVTLENWPDIWLHEGFATWSQWLWDEHVGRRTAQAAFDQQYARLPTSSFWTIAPAALPGAPELFTTQVYNRGAMTLQALRVKIGDFAFFNLLRAWYAENRGGNVSTADFVAEAEQHANQQLDAFFQTWLYTPGKPTSW